jgi:hypothetical protein
MMKRIVASVGGVMLLTLGCREQVTYPETNQTEFEAAEAEHDSAAVIPLVSSGEPSTVCRALLRRLSALEMEMEAVAAPGGADVDQRVTGLRPIVDDICR